MPKSGSTYVSRLLSECTGFRDLLLNDMIDGGQQELSRRRLRRSIGVSPGTVSHIHLRANTHNLGLIRRFDLKPIVLTRNLFDVVPSIADHFRRENSSGVTNYVPRNWGEMDDIALHDFVIHNCLPWYLGFLYSWLDATAEMEACWVSYEAFFADQVAGTQRILSFCGLAHREEDIVQSIERMTGSQTRLNKGVVGRGEQLLLPEQQEAVRQIARSWGGDTDRLRLVGVE